jgi:hypothetical protein
MPHASAFGSKLSVLKGISISMVQPISLCRTFAYQMPSHWRFWNPAPRSASPISPDGFISKKYPDCWLLNVSMFHMNRSSACRLVASALITSPVWLGVSWVTPM